MHFDATPDEPRSFGYKTNWFAVRIRDPRPVVEALQLERPTPANWESGFAAIYDSREGARIFVSPLIGDWIFVIGNVGMMNIPGRIDEHLQDPLASDLGREFLFHFSRLTKVFAEVQFFGSYSVVDFAAWVRVRKGEPLRAFAYCDGEVLMNIGERSPEEARLGFPDLSGLSPAAARDRIYKLAEEQNHKEEQLVAAGVRREDAVAQVRQGGRNPIPSEDDVIAVAAPWSLDPTRLEQKEHPPGVGVAAFLPKPPD